MNADEYDIEDHGDSALRDLHRRGCVKRAIMSGGVLKAHWSDPLGNSGRAWFFRGRRFTRGKQQRGYVAAYSGEEFSNLKELKASLE